MDQLASDVYKAHRAPDQVQVLRVVCAVDAIGSAGRRTRTGRRKLQRRAQARRPEMPVGDEAAFLPRKLDAAVRVDVAVGQESGDLVAADRIADVEVEAHIVLADRRYDADEGDRSAPLAAGPSGCGGGVAVAVAAEHGERSMAAAAGDFHDAGETRRGVAVPVT